MAAPTSVRVEANSITTTILRWTYSGSNSVGVYRSTDGVSYSEATDTRVLPGTTSYTDTGLSVGTKYWYKLSEDDGSTFSSVVTVWTHSCVGPVGGGNKPVTLPRFDDEEASTLLGDTSQVPGLSSAQTETTERLNEMARRIEAAFQGQEVAPDKCFACPADGALVIDCSNGCTNWTVVTEDGDNINSVSINWCGKFDGTIDVKIPPGATVSICGFPAGFGLSGDECTQAPISGGTNGRTIPFAYSGGGAAGGAAGISRPGTTDGVGQGTGTGGAGGSACTCVPGSQGELVIKSCNANNSLDCTGNKKLQLIACGGQGPYTWSHTGSVTLQVGANGTPGDTATGSSVIVKPPTNSGSGVAGDAYQECHYVQQRVPGCGSTKTTLLKDALIYGCDDVLNTDTNTPSGCGTAPATTVLKCIDALSGCDLPECAADHSQHYANAAVDLRSAGMISNGCNPCGVQAGATVTVTDALGTQVTIVVRQ